MSVLIDGDLVLYGFVGDNLFDEGFTAREVIDALAQLGRDADVNVRINSGGGYTADGVSIFNALKAHRGKVSVSIDAIAASAASIIAMAGDEIVMRQGALMMVHDPAMVTFGDADDHTKSVAILDRLADSMADIYAERTGQSAEDMREQMRGELWLTAEEAVEQGFADSADSAKAKTAAAFDYRIYAHAPQRLKTLAKRKDWSFETDSRAVASAPAPSRQSQENSMTDQPKAEEKTADIDKAKDEAAKAAVASYRERRKTVMALDETKGRETLAEHLIDTEMSVEGIKAALAAAPKAEAAQTKPYIEQKAEDGALGLGTPAKTTAKVPTWDKAVAKVNQRFGARQ